jgi:hypothetical protein
MSSITDLLVDWGERQSLVGLPDYQTLEQKYLRY